MILKKIYKNITAKNFGLYFLILLIVIVSSVNYPQLIGFWESGVIYESFIPTGKPLLFLAIQKAGDTSGYHGLYGYALLDLSRYLSDLLGHSISNVRLLSVFYGIISIILVFIICNRYFGIKIAIISSSLLITNLHFITFQNLLVFRFLAPTKI